LSNSLSSDALITDRTINLEEEDFKNYQNETKCFSLKKLPKGNVKAYSYNFDEFEFAIEQENELR
jgi:hypothetical protein